MKITNNSGYEQTIVSDLIPKRQRPVKNGETVEVPDAVGQEIAGRPGWTAGEAAAPKRGSAVRRDEPLTEG